MLLSYTSFSSLWIERRQTYGGGILQPPLRSNENVTQEKLHIWIYASQRDIQKGCFWKCESIPNTICFSVQNAPFDDKSKRQMTEISLTEQRPKMEMYKEKILFSL